MSRRNYLSPQFLTKISDDGTLNIESLIILTCAIFIASIGLNVNSTAIIIGAMLISPLMGPLLAIGTGLALYNTNILRKGAISLLAEIIISLIASTIYFHFLLPLFLNLVYHKIFKLSISLDCIYTKLLPGRFRKVMY